MKQRLYEDAASDALNSWNETGDGPDLTDKKGSVPGNNDGDKPQTPKTPDNGGNKTTPRRKGSDNTVCINKVQNLLKELNPSFNVSGSMDNNTLIEIMNKLNELETSLTVTKDEVSVIEKPKNLPTLDISEL